MNGRVIFRWILFFVAVFLLTLGGNWLRQKLSPHESGPLADVTWETGGEPHQVQVLLVDEQGKPLITTLITIYTNSGYYDCATDLRGVAIAECSGNYLVGIHSQHHSVFSKPLAGITGWPALKEGLKFKIVAKRPDIIAAPQDYPYATPEEISAAQSAGADKPAGDGSGD
jgi:hypothetical protein